MSSPNRARNLGSISGGGSDATPLLLDVFPADLLLELHFSVEQGLWSGRTAGHVDVDGLDLVDHLGDGLRVTVGSVAVGADAVGYYVIGLGHLFAAPMDREGQLV